MHRSGSSKRRGVTKDPPVAKVKGCLPEPSTGLIFAQAGSGMGPGLLRFLASAEESRIVDLVSARRDDDADALAMWRTPATNCVLAIQSSQHSCLRARSAGTIQPADAHLTCLTILFDRDFWSGIYQISMRSIVSSVASTIRPIAARRQIPSSSAKRRFLQLTSRVDSWRRRLKRVDDGAVADAAGRGVGLLSAGF